jgi:proline iminopeptidase
MKAVFARPANVRVTKLHPTMHERYIPAGNTGLYYREIDHGQPIIMLYGGPDFDHDYFLLRMDRLSDSFRITCYDQRGRGRSRQNVQPADVSIVSEMADLEVVRQDFRLEKSAVLGHSWGGLLVME